MGRGPGGSRTGDIAATRRKGSRRAAAARVRQEQRRRLRATERKNTRRFLRVAARVAGASARSLEGKVTVARSGGAKGLRGLVQWTEATIQLRSTDVTVLFTVAGRHGSGSSNAIQVRAGRKLVRPCPEDLLQSGDRRAFATWLREALQLALERSAPGAR